MDEQEDQKTSDPPADPRPGADPRIVEITERLERMREVMARSNDALTRLRDENMKQRHVLEQWANAFGVMTQLHPLMDLNVNDPKAMALEIVRHVQLEQKKHEQLNEPPFGILSIRIACGKVRSEHLMPSALLMAASDPGVMAADALREEIEKVVAEIQRRTQVKKIK